MSDRPTFRQAIEEEEQEALSQQGHTHIACLFGLRPHAGHSSREQSLESCRNFPPSLSLSSFTSIVRFLLRFAILFRLSKPETANGSIHVPCVLYF